MKDMVKDQSSCHCIIASGIKVGKKTMDTSKDLQRQQTPLPMILSGTQKTLIAIGVALVVLKQRNEVNKFRESSETENYVFIQKERFKEKEIDGIIHNILSSIINPSLPSTFHESLFSADPIFHFDVAIFFYDPSSDFTKHTLIKLRDCLKALSIANHDLNDFKTHVGMKVLQKAFGENESSFKNLLCVLWDVCKEESSTNSDHIVFYTFIDAIVVALHEVSLLEEIPDCVTDDDVAQRIHVLVI